MFAPRTVFVVGAGASCDLKLPTGDELRSDLMKVLTRDGNNHIFQNANVNRIVRGLVQAAVNPSWTIEFDEYAKAADRIRVGLRLATSIDNFLDAHQGDRLMVEMGKLAIATVILEKETASPLGLREEIVTRGLVRAADMANPDLAKSWYLPLMRLLVAGRTVNDVAHLFENVAFIVFNYDRLLEHFFVNAIIAYFNVDEAVAIDAVKKLTVIHPYGTVGRLPWQDDDGREIANFGHTGGNLQAIANGIRTFTESIMSGTVAGVKNLVSDAETIVFMGFGFLPQNMELLRVERPSSVSKVFLTTKGIGDNDIGIVTSEIRTMVDRKPSDTGQARVGHFIDYVERGTCRDLMDHNWLQLTR